MEEIGKTVKKRRKIEYLEHLDDVDYALIELKLSNPTFTYLQYAEAIKLGTTQVWKRMNSPEFKEALFECQKKAIDIILEAKEAAARKLIKHIMSRNDAVSLKACVAILADVLPEAKFKVTHDGEVSYVSQIDEGGRIVIGKLNGETKKLPVNGNGIH